MTILLKSMTVFRWWFLLIPSITVAQVDFSETQAQMEFQHQAEIDDLKSKLQYEEFRRRGLETEEINRELADKGRQEDYNPEAAVALGIEPAPPKVPVGASPAVIAAQARAGVPIITPPGAPQGVSQERWQQYQLELQRYNAALARYNEQRMQETQRQAAEQQAAEQQRQLEAQRQQQQREVEEQWRQYYAAKQFEDACQASRIEAAKRYPEFADPNSELTKKYLEIQKRLTEERSAIMDDSDYPKHIADMAAKELGIAPKQ
jgi:hypothetical protein